MDREKRDIRKVLGPSNWFRKEREDDGEEVESEKEKGRPYEGIHRGPSTKRHKRGVKLGKRKGKTWAEGVEATLFVPYTPKSALARELQEMEDQFSEMMKVPRIKIIERAGRTIMDVLGRPDPWAGQDCGRKGCWPCSGTSKEGMKSKGKCRKEGLVYRILCHDCQKQGVL